MMPKKKDGSSASDSSSSSSSSTSSSSSSSGSESSSTDTENSSSSRKSGRGSTDSEKKKSKKKTDTALKNKNDVTEVEAKNKEKPKRRASNSAHKVLHAYSSESDDTKSKRKPQTKPKASATITPITKIVKPISKPTNKKNIPALKQAQKPAAKSSIKNEAQKKLVKTKSIFSPDNSSDSDTATPPPPKLTAMKTAAVAIKTSKEKPNPKKDSSSHTPSDKSIASSVTSNNSSGSSNSTGNSSDSDASAHSVPTDEAKTQVPRAKPTPVAKPRGVGRPRKTPLVVPPVIVSDSDANSSITTRKLTRSVSARSIKHLTGKTPSDSETESESRTSTSLSKSPVKKAGPKGPASQRKPKGRGSSEPVVEERKCPLEQCDSSGHLSGKLPTHFTLEACPMYHNKTPQQCKDAYQEHLKREEERKKAIMVLKSSHTNNPMPDQKAYRELVKEQRNKANVNQSDNEDSSSSDPPLVKEREPDLNNRVNPYDLRLFQEAQAIASETIEEELKTLPNVRGTKCIEMGKFEMEVWYQSPYPDDYSRLPKLYLCEYCLRYMKSRVTFNRHTSKCVWRHPPGDEVYRKDKVSVWEVDGKRYKLFCQNLCLLAKFFLDHKTLYYDVEPFLFYVMTIADSDGCHTVGYFSKEKNSFLNYNVSCILTLPPYQRQGYGRLLIDFSYLLTREEGKIGSPEKPLSDLGLISYRSYWKDVLLEYLCNLEEKTLSIKDMSQEMAINSYDIVSTLQALGMMKYWKGKHIILKKKDVIEEYQERAKRRGPSYKAIDRNYLKWTPFVSPHKPAAT